jgi:hypothetical protein
VDDRKNLPEHETLIRRYCATTPEPKSEFTEKKLLYLGLCSKSIVVQQNCQIQSHMIVQVAATVVDVSTTSVQAI